MFEIVILLIILLLIITIYIGATIMTAIETLLNSVANLKAAVAEIDSPANNAAILAVATDIDTAVANLKAKLA